MDAEQALVAAHRASVGLARIGVVGHRFERAISGQCDQYWLAFDGALHFGIGIKGEAQIAETSPVTSG